MPEGVEARAGNAKNATRRRQRAPKRSGHRAQLTVPDRLWDAAVAIADQAGTTPNDVLVQLAGERLADRRRTLELRRMADARWAAFVAESSALEDDLPALSADELVDLGQALRGDGAL